MSANYAALYQQAHDNAVAVTRLAGQVDGAFGMDEALLRAHAFLDPTLDPIETPWKAVEE